MDHRIGSVSQKWNTDLVHAPFSTIAGWHIRCVLERLMRCASIMQERGDNSYVVVYFKINLRKDAEAHEQNWIKIREFVISLNSRAASAHGLTVECHFSNASLATKSASQKRP
jgi:hypothetical protein